MTSKNMSCRLPFLLKPVGKDYLWGGNRLNEDFGKNIAMSPLAETWECSTHPDGTSVVNSGEFAGMLLSDVLKKRPEYLGSHPRTKDELPILIKLIDAAKDLSVQVHPTDEYAFEQENGSLGKSELWYVLDAAEDASLIYGFCHDMDEDKLRWGIENGDIEKYLQRIPVEKDDVFFVEAGTVHAIGAGALIAEIQENSNLTYRLYDYNRVDKNGKKRELHIEKALKVANLKSSSAPRQPMRLLQYRPGYASEFLCRCKYFQVERILLNTAQHNVSADFQTGSNSFQVLLCTEGKGVIREKNAVCEDTDACDTTGEPACRFQLEFQKGDCIFVPAESEELILEGSGQLLKVQC